MRDGPDGEYMRGAYDGEYVRGAYEGVYDRGAYEGEYAWDENDVAEYVRDAPGAPYTRL